MLLLGMLMYFFVPALAIASGDTPSPTPLGSAGKTIFTFGTSLPTIICAPLRLCVIALQAGEMVNSIHMGDKERWEIVPTFRGTQEFNVPQLVVKPKESHVETSVTVSTDKRTYLFQLAAKEDQFMPYIEFTYPTNQQEAWSAFIRQQEKHKRREPKKDEAQKVKETAKRIATIDSNYTVEGRALWKPQLVYNDGLKSYIQFPESIVAHEMPILIVMSKEGEEMQVNYRIIGRTMKVDYLFEEALLVSGVGSNQERVVIERGNR